LKCKFRFMPYILGCRILSLRNDLPVSLPEIAWRILGGAPLNHVCSFKLRLRSTTLNSSTTSVASYSSSDTTLTRSQLSTTRTAPLIAPPVKMSAKTTVTTTASGYPPLRRPLASQPRYINSPNKPRAVSNPNPNKRPRSPDPSLPTGPVAAHPVLKRLKKEHIAATIGTGKEPTARASATTTTSKPLPSAVSSKRSKAEKAAAEEEFRVKYGRAFPSWKFYFEAVPQAAVASATRKILELNGVCPNPSRRDATRQ